jgi:hypothetical protein
MSATYGWRIVRPESSDGEIDATVAGILAEKFGDGPWPGPSGVRLSEKSIPYLEGLADGLRDEAAQDLHGMIVAIRLHGAIEVTVEY